jgi:hypothetical protein
MKSSFSPVMHLTSDIKSAALYARVSTEDQGKLKFGYKVSHVL